MAKISLEQIQADVLARHNLDLTHIDLDDPTSEDTKFHQELASKIESARKEVAYSYYQELRNILDHAPQHQRSRTLMISWLNQVGYTNIYVKGNSKPIPLEQAPSTNVYAFYRQEVAALSRKVRQMEKTYF
jgi:hypothetical protein